MSEKAWWTNYGFFPSVAEVPNSSRSRRSSFLLPGEAWHRASRTRDLFNEAAGFAEIDDLQRFTRRRIRCDLTHPSARSSPPYPPSLVRDRCPVLPYRTSYALVGKIRF